MIVRAYVLFFCTLESLQSPEEEECLGYLNPAFEDQPGAPDAEKQRKSIEVSVRTEQSLPEEHVTFRLAQDSLLFSQVSENDPSLTEETQKEDDDKKEDSCLVVEVRESEIVRGVTTQQWQVGGPEHVERVELIEETEDDRKMSDEEVIRVSPTTTCVTLHVVRTSFPPTTIDISSLPPPPPSPPPPSPPSPPSPPPPFNIQMTERRSDSQSAVVMDSTNHIRVIKSIQVSKTVRVTAVKEDKEEEESPEVDSFDGSDKDCDEPVIFSCDDTEAQTQEDTTSSDDEVQISINISSSLPSSVL